MILNFSQTSHLNIFKEINFSKSAEPQKMVGGRFGCFKDFCSNEKQLILQLLNVAIDQPMEELIVVFLYSSNQDRLSEKLLNNLNSKSVNNSELIINRFSHVLIIIVSCMN